MAIENYRDLQREGNLGDTFTGKSTVYSHEDARTYVVIGFHTVVNYSNYEQVAEAALAKIELVTSRYGRSAPSYRVYDETIRRGNAFVKAGKTLDEAIAKAVAYGKERFAQTRAVAEKAATEANEHKAKQAAEKAATRETELAAGLRIERNDGDTTLRITSKGIEARQYGTHIAFDLGADELDAFAHSLQVLAEKKRAAAAA